MQLTLVGYATGLISSLTTTSPLPLGFFICPVHLSFLATLNQTTRWRLLDPPTPPSTCDTWSYVDLAFCKISWVDWAYSMHPCLFFHPDDRRSDIVCWKDTPIGIFYICNVWNVIRPFKTKWSGGSLYGIDMLSHDSLSSYGLLFVRLFQLRISSSLLVLFRLRGASYVGVVVKMLTLFFYYPFY
jgi:hypothetical protein